MIFLDDSDEFPDEHRQFKVGFDLEFWINLLDLPEKSQAAGSWQHLA